MTGNAGGRNSITDGVVVRQFEFAGWPDNALVPLSSTTAATTTGGSSSSSSLLSLLELLETWQQRSGNQPITVHCM